MSRASAYIQAVDGERVAYGIYCGTSDVLMPYMCATGDEPWDLYYARNGRSEEREGWWQKIENCTHEPEVGYAYSSYGGGFYWPVKFCRECMVVHGPLDWDAMDEQLVKPTGSKPWWPLDGEPPIETTGTDVERWLLSERSVR